MAAFRSLCDSDLDSDGEAPLVILEQVEPVKRDREEEEEEEDEEEEEVEVEQIKVVNHIKSGIIQENISCLSNSTVAGLEASSRDSVNNMNNMQTELLIISTANGDNGLCDGPLPVCPSSPPSSPSPDPPSDLPASPSPPPVSCQPSPEELRSIRLRNNNVRQLIYKEVKKPGRGHVELWDMLTGLHGPPWVRRQFIEEVRQEAVRFKRSRLAEQLQKRSDSLSKLEPKER